jgi:hypothetical protein
LALALHPAEWMGPSKSDQLVPLEDERNEWDSRLANIEYPQIAQSPFLFPFFGSAQKGISIWNLYAIFIIEWWYHLNRLCKYGTLSQSQIISWLMIDQLEIRLLPFMTPGPGPNPMLLMMWWESIDLSPAAEWSYLPTFFRLISIFECRTCLSIFHSFIHIPIRPNKWGIQQQQLSSWFWWWHFLPLVRKEV